MGEKKKTKVVIWTERKRKAMNVSPANDFKVFFIIIYIGKTFTYAHHRCIHEYINANIFDSFRRVRPSRGNNKTHDEYQSRWKWSATSKASKLGRSGTTRPTERNGAFNNRKPMKGKVQKKNTTAKRFPWIRKREVYNFDSFIYMS